MCNDDVTQSLQQPNPHWYRHTLHQIGSTPCPHNLGPLLLPKDPTLTYDYMPLPYVQRPG
jgi:hypothetical protein